MLNKNALANKGSQVDSEVTPKRYGIIQIVSDAVHNRLDVADDDLAQHRQHLCFACSTRIATLNLCAACGCHIPSKTKLAKATCPKDLW